MCSESNCCTYCVPTLVPTFVAIRHLVLDPISVPNSLVPILGTIRQLILNPIFNFGISVPFILFTLLSLVID